MQGVFFLCLPKLSIKKYIVLVISILLHILYHVRNNQYKYSRNTQGKDVRKNMTNDNATSKKLGFSVAELALCGMCIALTFVATALIHVQLPIGGEGGLVHLGNVPMFLAAMLFGRRIGALAGGLGMALFDITSGWAIWAPCTLITVGLMGYMVGWITEKNRGFVWKIVAVLVATVIKIAGYYIAEVIMYGNWITPTLSIPGNILQMAAGAVIALLMVQPLQTIVKKM